MQMTAQIRIGDTLVLSTTSVGAVVNLQVAILRRFGQGQGCAVTFVGFGENNYGDPAGHETVWFHPSMPVVFDYGTDSVRVEVDDAIVDAHLQAMDDGELGVLISPTKVDYALLTFAPAPRPR